MSGMESHGALSHVRGGRAHVCLPNACTIGLVSTCWNNWRAPVIGVNMTPKVELRIFVRQFSNIASPGLSLPYYVELGKLVKVTKYHKNRLRIVAVA